MSRWRWKNTDRNGVLVKQGDRVYMGGYLADTGTLKYDNRLGWHYSSDRHGQDFIMPWRIGEQGDVRVFHLAEVMRE